MTADEYIRQVEVALRDLPWSQRRDLVAELRAHLAELPPDTDLTARLGAPPPYAAEMRTAAGIERRHGPIAYLRARRPRNLVLTAVALALIGLAIGTPAWINAYQPLTAGGWGSQGDAHESPTGDGIYYVFHEGKRFQYGMSILNSGRFTVRVVGVPIEFGLPVKYRLLMWPKSMKDGWGPAQPPWIPFKPFDLKPGDERGIVLRGTYGESCAYRMPGLSTGFDAIPIRFDALWHTKTASVPLNEPVFFVFTKASACPKTKR